MEINTYYSAINDNTLRNYVESTCLTIGSSITNNNLSINTKEKDLMTHRVLLLQDIQHYIANLQFFHRLFLNCTHVSDFISI